MKDADVRSLWDFSKVAESRERFAEALASAHDEEEKLIWQTQIARTYGLESNFEMAHALLDEVEQKVGGIGLMAQSYYLLERGRVFNSSQQKEMARPLFAKASEIDLPGLRLDAVHMMAIAAEDRQESVRLNREGLAAAQKSMEAEDRRWIGPFSNNLGWDLHDMGEFEAALEVFEFALEFRVAEGVAMPIHIAKWSVARCLRSLGRFSDAMLIQQELKASGVEDSYVDDEIAELEKQIGA